MSIMLRTREVDVPVLDITLGLHQHPRCRAFWLEALYDQMAGGKYDDDMSVLNLQPVSEWQGYHKTARRRAIRAERRGYKGCRINRAVYNSDITDINLSATHRQGRPMTDGYREPVSYDPLPSYPCQSHAIRDYGVTNGSTLLAYAFVYRSGELALVSQILGHAKFLRHEIMYLLVQEVLRFEYAADPHGYLVYNRHDSGTDGLRFFKERCGFQPLPVEWLP